MWIPRTEREIIDAVEAGALEGTATFDAKRSLPRKNKDLAVDVAAMANDGGTLLYGLGEDEHGRLAEPMPFALKGSREQVDQIIRTSISESPYVQILEIPTDADPSVGYLVVHVPPSERSPHMVVVKGEYRYYGRGATGNSPLNEGDVARLYERRQRVAVDRDALFDETMDRAPIEPVEGFAYLHLFARPVVTDEGVLDRARGVSSRRQFVLQLAGSATRPEVFPVDRYSPDLPGHWLLSRSEGWAVSRGLGEEWEAREYPGGVLEIIVGPDGRGRLFCGRAGEARDGRLDIFEIIIAGLTTRFLKVMGNLYFDGTYLGGVDVGVVVTGLADGVSAHSRNRFSIGRPDPTPYDRDVYARTGRYAAYELYERPRGVARDLTMPLINALTGDSYDPFAETTGEEGRA